MRLDVYIHYPREENVNEKFNELLRILTIHNSKLNTIMALDKESLDLLVEINDSTTEISDDITELINKAGTVAEFKAALRPIADKLKGVASQYTKDTPVEEPPAA